MSKKRMNAEKLIEIMRWSDKGLNATDVAKVCGISDSSSQNYIRIIRQIRNGQNYSCHPSAVNEKSITEYCAKTGLEKTVNTYGKEEFENATEQLQFLNTESSADEVRAKVIDAVNLLLNFLLEVKG